MHELSVAKSLIDVLIDQLGTHDANVSRIKLRIGVLSGVLPAALQTAFRSASKSTPFERAALDIEESAVALWCANCQQIVLAKSMQSLRCSACDTPSADVRRGRELEVVEMELSDE